jgi:hypothetical protein
LRKQLPTEKRIKVLMLAQEQMERNRRPEKAKLVGKRLSQLCAKENTVVTIRFRDGGQDFSEWDLNGEGCVIDCRPCQAGIWCGTYVVNCDKLKVGGTVVIFTHDAGRSVVNYRIASLTPGPAAAKYPDHKPDNMTLHDAGPARPALTAAQHNKYPRGRNA